MPTIQQPRCDKEVVGRPLPLPAGRAERFAFRENFVGHASVVTGVYVNGIAPPCLDAGEANGAVLRVLKSEEDDDQTNSITCV